MTSFYLESSARRGERGLALIADGPRPHGHRIAIVGAGMMGREHLRVANLLGRAEIGGVYDPCAESVEQAGVARREFSDLPLHRYESLEAIRHDDTLDAVFVCSPNYTHWSVVQALLPCSKALLIEKPMATSLGDALAMRRALQHHPAPVQLGMQYRFKAQYVDAFRAVVEDAVLGRVRTISMAEYRPPFLDKVGQWNKFSGFSGGTLVEKCCHYFDLMNLIADARPARIYASGGRAVNFLDFEQAGERADIDDHAFVIIDYENGVRGNFTLNMFARELCEELVVTGDAGRVVATERATFRRVEPSASTLQVEVDGDARYRPVSVGYPPAIEESGHYGATFFAQDAFFDQLDGGQAQGATLEQGLWAIIVAVAAQESMRRGAAVSIAELLDSHGIALAGLDAV